ncbi:hypothetical protein [Parasphingorhabdus flavimaris]|uniref:hypothetical protein n=1 Tax=Parasphingorhabdus flavimaris TaxID=266812 RepID=UPI003002DD09
MNLLWPSLYAQIVWCVLASAYNCLSLLAIANGGIGFAGDASTTQSAMVAVVIFGAVTLAGFLGRVKIYKVLSPIVVIALCVGGVLKHLNLGPATYASEWHWIVAILINSFGVIAYTIGAFASYRGSRTKAGL